MNPFRIEKLQDIHLEAVRQIYNHYVLNSTATFHAQALGREDMVKLVFFPDPRHQAFVILDGETVCGYAFIAQHKPRDAYDFTGEVSVYLRPGYENKGLGSLALRHLEEHAKAHGFHVLLATICGQNQASLQLFNRSGFHRCAHFREVGRKFGQWLDIIVCQKILD
jgi:phosphinothricin acetyltransferase